MTVCHYASGVRFSHCRCFNLQCSLKSDQERSLWWTDNLQEDHTFHRRGKSAFLSQEGSIEKSECSDQGAWFQSQRAPGHDPLCYRSDSNIRNLLFHLWRACSQKTPRSIPTGASHCIQLEMWDNEFEESNPGVRPDMSIRWSLSFKQIVAPQEPITYHVRQPTVCSSLRPVSICGSSIPVYTYIRGFLDPYEMKLQGNTVNQQAHQYLRYFFSVEAWNGCNCSCWECSGGKIFTWIGQQYGQHGRSDQADQEFLPQVF